MVATTFGCMRRILILIAFVALASACGGDAADGPSAVEAGTTTSQVTAPTEAPSADTTEAQDTGADDDEVPEGLFEPPGSQEVTDVSGNGTRWSIVTTAPFDEVRRFYQELLGDDGNLAGAEGSREAIFSDTMGVPPAYVLWVKEDGDSSRVTISTP